MIRTFLLLVIFTVQAYTPIQKASYQYVALSQQEAFEVSKSIIPDGGTPGNICGPLTLSILKDAGYVSDEIPTKSFWFLRPFDKYTQDHILEPAFPQDSWDWFFFKNSLLTFDFEEFPLLPGDVIFLPYNHKCGGTFSHIFVVNRVDGSGNPYTVTNHQTSKGWRISEVKLYNLYNDEVGYFDILTDQRNNQTVGTTGYCGFYLWRPSIQSYSPVCQYRFCPH